jgi:hypothetical protein
MQVTETFCVPSECDNSEDLAANLVVKWYDAQYKSIRPSFGGGWMVDYSDTLDLDCPSIIVTVILSLVGAIIVVIVSIPVGLFLFKAPKERGRVLKGVDDDEDDTPVESMAPIADQ